MYVPYRADQDVASSYVRLGLHLSLHSRIAPVIGTCREASRCVFRCQILMRYLPQVVVQQEAPAPGQRMQWDLTD